MIQYKIPIDQPGFHGMSQGFRLLLPWGRFLNMISNGFRNQHLQTPVDTPTKTGATAVVTWLVQSSIGPFRWLNGWAFKRSWKKWNSPFWWFKDWMIGCVLVTKMNWVVIFRCLNTDPKGVDDSQLLTTHIFQRDWENQQLESWLGVSLN